MAGGTGRDGGQPMTIKMLININYPVAGGWVEPRYVTSVFQNITRDF